MNLSEVNLPQEVINIISLDNNSKDGHQSQKI